jgi:hypothetical protein
MRTVRSLASILFLGAAATALSGCDQEETKVQFAQVTEAQRAAVVPAALGLTGEQAANLVTLAEIDHVADASCPTRTIVDDAIVYEAKGCQGAASGITWKGRIEAVNSPRTDRLGAAIDASKPEELRFFDLHADRIDVPLTVDGVLRLTAGASNGEQLVSNQLTTSTGESIRLSVDLSCTLEGGSRVCKTLPGASGELLGVGRFDIAATLSTTLNDVSGQLVLRGEDDLRVDTNQRTAKECLIYQVAGKEAGHVCLPELGSDDATHVDGVSWTCGADNAISLTGFAEGAPVFTKVELLRKGVREKEIALSFAKREPTTQVDRWASAATPLDAGSFSCAQLSDIGIRVVAVFADGTTDCYVTGNWDAFDGRTCF